MPEVEWRPQALKDLEEIESYYKEVAPEYATYFVEKVFEKTQQLKKNPRMGRMVPEIEDEAIRELIYRDYRVIYFVDSGDKEVAILAIYHSARQFGSPDFGIN